MTLVAITEEKFDITLDLRYSTHDNLTGHPIYQRPLCFLHAEAISHFEKAIDLAARQGLRFKIFDAFRPQQAQEILWAHCPDETYIMPPTKGSGHTRGISIDLTLVDAQGNELDMGTPFDSFDDASHHGSPKISKQAELNRYILLGIMSTAGWDFYKNEWWHFQLFNAKSYPLILDDYGMMTPDLSNVA